MSTTHEGFVKVIFILEKDEDDYPPEDVESMWAKKLDNGLFQIDNIPHFVTGVSDGDEVEAEMLHEQWTFVRVVKPSSNCTVQVIIYDKSRVAEVREALLALNCHVEGTGIEGMLALSVDKSEFGNVHKYLVARFDEDLLDYQEAALR